MYCKESRQALHRRQNDTQKSQCQKVKIKYSSKKIQIPLYVYFEELLKG